MHFMNIIQDEQKPKIPKGKGFYITLAACCAAVVVAGWSTYRSIKDSPGTTKSETHEKASKTKQETVHRNANTKSKPKGEITDKGDTVKENPVQNKKEEKSYDFSQKILADEEDDDEDIQSVLSDSTENLIVYPTNNNVIKEFSDGKPVYSKTLGDWRVHDGVDFKADRGSLVKSITSGTVKDIYNDPSYGTTIVIEHDPGFVGYYSGLGDTTLVQKGDKVKAGDDIGSINNVPVEISEEPHLHLMINKDGKFIDPILILDKETE